MSDKNDPHPKKPAKHIVFGKFFLEILENDDKFPPPPTPNEKHFKSTMVQSGEDAKCSKHSSKMKNDPYFLARWPVEGHNVSSEGRIVNFVSFRTTQYVDFDRCRQQF